MPPPPPELIDDSIAEILLHLPPDDPACLERASLVCKLWRRILSEPTFPNRYRGFHHRRPPLLGYLCGYSSRFVPVVKTGTHFLHPGFKCRPLESRLPPWPCPLFDAVGCRRTMGRLAVWDPITGDHTVISDPDPGTYCHSGVVLCAAAAGCNHSGCHGGPFLVVIVSTSYNAGNKVTKARVYSSEAGAWRAPASVQIPQNSYVQRKRAAIVGGHDQRQQLYFLLSAGHGIVKYDLGKQCSTIIGSPAADLGMHNRPVLMAMEDGSLGLVCLKDEESTILHLWKAKVNPDDGSMRWVRDRVILVNNLVPDIGIRMTYTYDKVNVVGFAEGVNIIFLGQEASGFVFELKSGQFKKLSNPGKLNYDVFPYMSFHIPDFAGRKTPLPVETKQ